MPRKTKKNKKGVKDKKELKANSCEIIDIGNNVVRWNSIKKQFNFKSDEDFVDHLLDLAEQELSKTEKGDNVQCFGKGDVDVDQFLESRDGNATNFAKSSKKELLPSSLKEEKKNSKMSSFFHTAESKLLMDDKINLENSTQTVLLQDRRVSESASDEEKENVGIISCENQPRLNSELSCPLSSDNLAKRTAEITLLDSSNNNDILKETEQNLDYSKIIKKHKKRITHESPSSCTLLDTSQNTSKHKKKKQIKNFECGKVSDPITSSDVSNKSDVLVTLSVNESNDTISDGTIDGKVQSDVVRTDNNENNEMSDHRLDSSVVKNHLKSDSEIHRVSITIKLCCDCDSRHLQDGCPLRNPQKIIHDSVDINNWLRSNSPDLQYRDEESSSYENSRTDFSSASLPECLELKVIDSEHGISVVARETLSASTQFGPLIGQPIKEMEIPDDFSMKDIWEVIEDGRCSYISTQDSECSNWLRWLRPAPVREARNLAPIQTDSKLYFITTSVIPEGKELLYWADHISSAWSNKKMTKTNCGGCNLRFSHPIYYRRHCAVFHDPKFSLTIRKYHCKVCGLSVLGKENIMKHAADEHDGKGAYQCQYCKKFFLRLNYLEMHRTYGCSSNPHRTRPLCDYCGRKFCQPQKLKIHIKRMHSEISEVLREFQCKRCMKVLGSRAALQRHIKEVHHKAMLGSCTCDKCGKMFQNKSNLKIHMLTHSGIKPFKCQQDSCSAAFTTKQCLQFHYKKVHGFTDNKMPRIERSVAYTFDAYAGGMRPSSVNSNCSSTNSNTGIDSREMDDLSADQINCSSAVTSSPLIVDDENNHDSLRVNFDDDNINYNHSNNKLIASKASKKWMGEERSTDLFEFSEDPKEHDEHLRRNEPVSMIFRHCKPDSSNASLLVEAALDAAERDIEMSCNPIKLPSPIHSAKLTTSDSLYPIIHNSSSQLSPDRDLVKPITPPPPDYSLHSIQDINQSSHPLSGHSLDSAVYQSSISPTPRHASGYGLIFPERTSHYELRLSPSAAQIDTFHLHPDDVRYDLHHRRLDIDCSSDDGEGVQNLSLGLKNKSSLQLDLSSSSLYNKYDHNIDDHTNNFVESSLEGLDMSRSGVYHHSSFVSMTSHRYPHTIYDQRTTYSHSDVLRVVNLTHSVDLSLPRPNHLPIPPPPPPPSNQPIIEPIRVVSPPALYQNYPLSQSPYLPTNRAAHSPTYHHYSGF